MPRTNIPSPSPYAPVIAFSSAVKAGNLIFVSGTVGRDAAGNFEAGIYGQTKQALANIEAVLKQAGASMANVVRTRMFVTNVDLVDEVARAHREAFADIMPASTIVEVSRLAASNMLIEVEVDAVIDA